MAGTIDLAEILRKRDAVKYAKIIKRASLYGYHDHKFDSIIGHPEYGECICPKMQLVEDLGKFPELNSLRQDVMEGVYDESADAQDVAEMRCWMMDGNQPDEMFRQLGISVPTKKEREDWPKKKMLN